MNIFYQMSFISGAPKSWGLYFQDTASPQMEAFVESYGNATFSSSIILLIVSLIPLSVIGISVYMSGNAGNISMSGLQAEQARIRKIGNCMHPSVSNFVCVAGDNSISTHCDFGVRHAAFTRPGDVAYICNNCFAVICKNCRTA